MFTGIIEEMGKVKGIIRSINSIKLSIECRTILKDMKLGDSIAVNGICLTATDFGDSWFTADVMPETMRRTNLDKLKPSGYVNLERALSVSDRLGGHIVSGHIDGIGTIIEKKEEDNAVWLTIEAPQEILKYIVQKGSVALDGTSLTVAYIDNRSFKISLIPLTRGVTVLGIKEVGDKLNIECDVIGKYIEKLIICQTNATNNNKGLSMDLLKENGFI
ncbi:MAG: riboflavin synthase, alpha subunit [Clostridiales bacterium]|jgi:riboflavin synthase|nr:riboflavin synthase, alpha subunit [Clostridiales bacterium]